jgi:hypothetical protein
MVPLQFFAQNLHFIVSLFTALVFFAVFWLYFDAWTNRKHGKDLAKWSGYLLIALSFVVHATIIEQSVLGRPLLGSASEAIVLCLRTLGFIAVIIGLITDPMQAKPDNKGLQPEMFGADSTDTPPKNNKSVKAAPALLIGPFKALYALPPIGAVWIAVLYWRRATTGLERHLKPVAIAFLLLGVAELFGLATLLRDTTNPGLSQFVESFGIAWAMEHVFQLAGALMLGWWVWRYLTERFLSQLFMLFTGSTLAIFLLTTVSFTFLLMRNIQSEALSNLDTASKVLNYALDSKKAETLANTQQVAQNPEIGKAVVAKDRNALIALTDDFLATKKQSLLIITSSSGQVLLRAEDPDRWGDSLSSDTLVRRALVGQAASSTSVKDDVLAPLLYINSAAPIRDANEQIVGTAMVGLVADNAFVDGIKNATGLDSALYAGNIRSSTTFLAPDGKSRSVGVKETNRTVNDVVLKKGQRFKGPLSVLNRSFLATYTPIKDADNSIVGMMFIGKPQTSTLRTAGRSIELTFIVAAVLLILSIVPAYLMAQYLAKQLE